jgi:hypothetical protein
MERDYQGNFKVSMRDKICIGSIIVVITVITVITVGVVFDTVMLLRLIEI